MSEFPLAVTRVPEDGDEQEDELAMVERDGNNLLIRLNDETLVFNAEEFDRA